MPLPRTPNLRTDFTQLSSLSLIGANIDDAKAMQLATSIRKMEICLLYGH